MSSDEAFRVGFGDVRSHMQRAQAEAHSAASWLVFWRQTLALLRPLADHPRFADEVAPYVTQQLDASCAQWPRELSTSWLAEAFGAGWEVAPWGAIGSVCEVLWVEGETAPDDPMRRADAHGPEPGAGILPARGAPPPAHGPAACARVRR